MPFVVYFNRLLRQLSQKYQGVPLLGPICISIVTSQVINVIIIIIIITQQQQQQRDVLLVCEGRVVSVLVYRFIHMMSDAAATNHHSFYVSFIYRRFDFTSNFYQQETQLLLRNSRSYVLIYRFKQRSAYDACLL